MLATDPPLVIAIRRYHATVAQALRRGGVASADVDDLTQEVLSIFCRRFSDIAEPAQKSFLLETARRVARDHRNLKWNRAVLTTLDPELADSRCGAPEAELERHQARELVNDALCALGEADRQVFLLSHVELWSRTRIARHLSLPSGTVASRLRRANDLFSGAVARLSERRGFGNAALDAALPWRAPARSEGDSALPRGSAPLCGTHLYVDNQWGRARAEGGYDQCLLSRERAGQRELGWSWNWPGYHHDGFALPEIIVGWKPWLGGRPTDARFPLPLQRIQRLWMDFDVEQAAVGSHELVANLWLLHGNPSCGSADPSLIGTEIMIELDHTQDEPRHRFVESLTLGGERYDLWEESESQGSRLEAWPLLSLRRHQPITAGSFDLAEMLGVLAARGYVSARQSVGSVEFGNRVFGGQGTAWVRRFELDIAVQQ